MLVVTTRPLSPVASRLRRLWYACIASLVFPCVSTAVEDDDYLSAISMEAEKVEQSSLAGVQGPEVQAKDGKGSYLNDFESELKSRYRGSYTFYRKLPPRNREEVFQNYLDGVPMSDIRKKIMRRFLNN